MSTRNTPAPTPEELLARMEELGHELGVTSEALDALLRRHKQQRAQGAPVAGFPFNLLEWAIRRGLAFVERTVARLVWAIGRKDAN